MRVAIPTLGTDGWVNDPETVADYILSSFLTTNKSQTNLFRADSKSLQSTLMEFTNNMPGLEDELIDVLTRKFRKTFGDDSYVKVSIDPITDKPDQYSINLTAIVVSDGREYSVSKLVETESSRIVKINELNVNG